MHRISSKHLIALSLTLIGTFASAPLYAQQPSIFPIVVSLPSASSFSSSNDTAEDIAANQQQPSEPQSQQLQAPAGTGQSKRVLGIIPNFRSVGTNARLPPQSVKDKFIGASQDSFDYSSTIIPTFLAGYGYGRNSVPQFGTGGVGFGRYLWHTTVDQTVENYMVEFFVPVATHEDTRYYTLGRGGFFKRTGYALSRAVVTRSDSGKETFNISEIVGAGASAGISNLYYPAPQRTLSNTANNWTLDVGLDATTFVLREFWPDIDHRLFHDK